MADIRQRREVVGVKIEVVLELDEGSKLTLSDVRNETQSWLESWRHDVSVKRVRAHYADLEGKQ